MSSLRIATLVGSLRASSLNRRLYEHAVSVAPDDVELFEVPIGDVPHFNEDLRGGDETEAGYPAAVRELRAAIRDADAVLVVSPEYNYAVPGVLKNALDWASRAPDRPFTDKPVAIMGAAGGRLGTARMQYDLRRIMVALNAHPLNRPEVMVANARAEFGDAPDAAPQEMTTQLVRELLEALAAWTRTLRA